MKISVTCVAVFQNVVKYFDNSADLLNLQSVVEKISRFSVDAINTLISKHAGFNLAFNHLWIKDH